MYAHTIIKEKMCQLNKHNDGRRIDPCLREFIKNLNLLKSNLKILACCCGHGKYPMTIVVALGNLRYDLVSGKYITRKKRFYRKDKQGYYFIPEVKG